MKPNSPITNVLKSSVRRYGVNHCALITYCRAVCTSLLKAFEFLAGAGLWPHAPNGSKINCIVKTELLVRRFKFHFCLHTLCAYVKH